jgi:two-component system, NtrC family, response regulator HydG
MKRKPRLLVVDDDRRMTKTICDILRIKGYETIAVNSGEKAVEMVSADKFDCVLMDIKMTGMDGIETLRIIKRLAADLPVILMSAYATEDQKDEAKRCGAYTVLCKPIDIQLLLAFLPLLEKEKRILIVDDDPVFCKTLQDELASKGYRVESEIDPERVMNRMAHEYKLVVLLGLKVGGRDATEILCDIRKKYPTKPVILITGYGKEMRDSIGKAFEMGAYACLDKKPFQTDALVKHIEEIDRKKLQTLLGEIIRF